MFIPKTELRDFRFIEMGCGEDGRRRMNVLHSLDKLVPGKPLVVTSTTPTTGIRGVSFVDGNNTTRYFNISGDDGAPLLLEFDPSKLPGERCSPNPPSPQAKHESSSGASSTESKCVVKVRSGDVLWIRAEPSASAAGVGSIPPKTCGVIVYPNTCKGSWCKVQYGDYSGWANTKLLN